MEIELTNSLFAWVAPVLLFFYQLHWNKKEKRRADEHRKELEKWSSLQSFMEKNAVSIEGLDRRFTAIETDFDKYKHEAQFMFIARTEFNAFEEKLDEKIDKIYKDMREEHRTLTAIMQDKLMSAIKESISDLKVDLANHEHH